MSAIAEKYARATQSSHLLLKVEPGDLDVLIAAGMITEGLGTGLMRLRFEFDSISRMPGSRNMIPRLKSAASVRARMLSLSIQESARKNLDIGDDQILDIVARLLDQWVDPNCPNCDGRGSIGDYGSPQCICNSCGGAKRRSLCWPQEVEKFAEWIGSQMEVKVDTAQRRIQRLLRQD